VVFYGILATTCTSLPRTVRGSIRLERLFALLSQRQIKRGSHYSVRELEAAISEFIAVHNEQPKPFVWTKSADAMLNSIGRFASRTLAVQAQQICQKLMTQETSCPAFTI